MEMEIRSVVRDEDGTAVVLAGDYLNKITGQRVERECRRCIEHGCKQLIVDFSDTEIVNSIGVSILLGVIDSASSAGAKVVFSHLNASTAELFDLSGVTKDVSLAIAE